MATASARPEASMVGRQRLLLSAMLRLLAVRRTDRSPSSHYRHRRRLCGSRLTPGVAALVGLGDWIGVTQSQDLPQSHVGLQEDEPCLLDCYLGVRAG